MNENKSNYLLLKGRGFKLAIGKNRKDINFVDIEDLRVLLEIKDQKIYKKIHGMITKPDFYDLPRITIPKESYKVIRTLGDNAVARLEYLRLDENDNITLLVYLGHLNNECDFLDNLTEDEATLYYELNLN